MGGVEQKRCGHWVFNLDLLELVAVAPVEPQPAKVTPFALAAAQRLDWAATIPEAD